MKHLAVVAILSSSFLVAADAATVPFSENFDSYDNTTNPTVVPTGWTESSGALWNVRDDGAGNDYEFLNTQIDSSGTITTTLRGATVSLTNAVGNNFVVSAEMTIDAASGSGSSSNNLIVGLQFLGSGGFSPGYTAELDVLGTGLGTIRISENDSPLISGSITGTLTAGTIYALTVTGIYTAGSLALDFDFSGGSSTGHLSFVDATPQTGQLFGFRHLITTGSGGTVSLDVDYDNFSVVPEPGSASLLMLGAVMLAHRRRRVNG